MIDLATLESSALTPLLGQSFTVPAPGGDIALELADVHILGHKRREAKRDPFSITLRGPQSLRMAQGVHCIEHPAIGVLEILLTQIGDGPMGSEFEAVFT